MQWDQVVVYYLLYSLSGLGILLTLIHLLYRRRSAISITAWLLLLIIAPYFFVIIYFLFGIRKRSFNKEKSPLSMHMQKRGTPSVHDIDTLLRSHGIPPSTGDNEFKLYINGVEAYTALFEAIQAAQHSISLSTYVLKNDSVTAELFDLLIKKSQAGVEVRILTDAFGSIGIYLWKRSVKRLAEAGIHLSFFMPLLNLPFQNRLNLRYHRKIYLIDDKVLFSGGMNLAKEYMGPEYTQARWMDLLYRCEGSVVDYYTDIFESDWSYVEEERVEKRVHKHSADRGSCMLQVVPSGPDVSSDALLEAMIYGMHKASKRIWIVTPYFVPDEFILEALQIAYHRGVDIKLITPKESDHLMVNLVRSSYIRELQEWGVDVAFYEGAILHAKAILFDDDAVMLGSVNLDNRSLLLNYEVMSIAYSKKEIHQMDVWMKELLEHSSSDFKPAGKIRRIFENLMRIFALQL